MLLLIKLIFVMLYIFYKLIQYTFLSLFLYTIKTLNYFHYRFYNKMENININSRLNYKGTAVKFKDDDYETPKNILEMLLPYIKDYNIIYDPFYCAGRVKKDWEELGKTCINEKLDAFWRETPAEFDITISNIPFSCKEKCMELFFKLKKPFIILMPIDAMGSVWIKKYFDDLQIIIPKKRLNFSKNGIVAGSCWFDTCFYCYGLDLKKDIIKL